jgi:hypothetical protein
MTATAPNFLAIKNAHPRDEFITFDEGPHIYTIHGKQGYTSVTTWNHHHFPVFDSGKIIDNILNNSKHMTEPKYKYYMMTREQINEMWDKNRDDAASAGTKMHFDIECFYNGIIKENTSIEFGYFKKFVADFPELIPYRTEWMVYYEELKISGSIDMLFENPDGTLEIYDWKRAKEIAYDTSFGNFATTPCIAHLPDTNFHHYSLQLNMYRIILEHKYGKKINGMYLVCLHPDNPYKNYDRIEVPVLEKEMNALLEVRHQELEEKQTH